MSAMRIPKYTAGMFKKKMPRFGAPGIKMPRIPKPPKPRVKKFDEGGKAEADEIIVSPEAYYRSLPPDQQKKLKEKYDKKIAEAEAKQKREAEERKRREQERLRLRDRFETYTARKGGVMKSSCCRGDGIAKRGKTRGKFV
jgi:hypothetical protein